MKKIFTKTIMLFIALAIISGNLTAQATKSSGIKFKSPNNSSKELWDVLYYFDYTEVTSHSGFYAPFYWEGNLYIARWNLQLEENELGKIYKFNNNQGAWELEK